MVTAKREPYKFEAVCFLAIGVMTLLSGISMVGLVIHKWMPAEDRDTHGQMEFLLGTFGLHMGILALTWWFLAHHRMRWRDFLDIDQVWPRRVIWKGLAAGAGLLVPALAMKYGIVWLMEQFSMSAEEQKVVEIIGRSEHWGQMLMFGVSAIVLAPVVEEILFRGIMYRYLKQVFNPMLGLAVSSVVFAAIHFNTVTFLPLVYLAIGLVYIYEHTGSLVAPILAHAFFNGINFIILLWQNGTFDWLTHE